MTIPSIAIDNIKQGDMLLADGTIAFTTNGWEYVVWQDMQGDFYIICDLGTKEYLLGHCEGEHNVLQGFTVLELDAPVPTILSPKTTKENDNG